MTRFEEVRGRLVARADEQCPICSPKTPRTDVSPPSRRSADPSSQAEATSAPPPAKPPVLERWRGLRESRIALAADDRPEPRLPDPGRHAADPGVDWAKVAVWLVLVAFCVLAWVGIGLLVRHVWLAVS